MDKKFDIDFAINLDKEDPISSFRKEFNIPKHNNGEAIYFTGHSLGLQPKNYRKYLDQELNDWKCMGVKGHFNASSPWYEYHKFLSKNSASIVGANETEVVSMNGLSVNLHLLLILSLRFFSIDRYLIISFNS